MEHIQTNFQRRPGRKGGCGCCGLWFAGLAALPLLAGVALFRAYLSRKEGLK